MQVPPIDLRSPGLPPTPAAAGTLPGAVAAGGARAAEVTLPQTMAAVLRAFAVPDLGPLLGALLNELTAVPDPLGMAARVVREAIRRFLPADGRPPDATQLQRLVEDGGLHYEAKVARGSAGGGLTPPARQEFDLKAGLLQLLGASHDLGDPVELPAARAALEGIAAQQAANVLAGFEGTPFVLQVPFPDGGQWRTLHLAVERDGRRGSAGGGFRLLLHVPLSGLGDVWVDAALGGGRVRAVVYLDDEAARGRVRAGLPDLRRELRAGGFAEVLLDVRPATDLPGNRRQLAAAMAAGRSGDGAVLDVEA